jgi:hypothetical protein
MKVLLDECVPEQVRNALSSHSVFTVKEMGSRGYKNGKLLAAVEKDGFDLFIAVFHRFGPFGAAGATR